MCFSPGLERYTAASWRGKWDRLSLFFLGVYVLIGFSGDFGMSEEPKIRTVEVVGRSAGEDMLPSCQR